MENKSYKLRYLPLFEQDLISTANYITNVLKNEDAAIRLVDDVEAAILERLNNPVAFEPYPSAKKRDYPYYRINVWCKRYGQIFIIDKKLYKVPDTNVVNLMST